MATKSPEQILSEAAELMEILRPANYSSGSLDSLAASHRMLDSAIKFAREREVDLRADIEREASAAAGLIPRLITEFKESCDAEQTAATKQIKAKSDRRYVRSYDFNGQRHAALLRLAIGFPDALGTITTVTAGKTKSLQKICAEAQRVSEACPTGEHNSPVKDLNKEYYSLKQLLAARAETAPAAALVKTAGEVELRAELVAHFTKKCILWVRAAYGEDSELYAAVRGITPAEPKRTEQEKPARKATRAKPGRLKLARGAASNS